MKKLFLYKTSIPGRVAISFPLLLHVLVVLSQSSTHQHYEIMVHMYSTLALFFVLLVVPYSQLLVGLSFIGLVAQYVTWELAMSGWPGGDDGGGFRWFLLVAPSGLFSAIWAIVFSAYFSEKEKEKKRKERKLQKERELMMQAPSQEV